MPEKIASFHKEEETKKKANDWLKAG